MSRVIVVCAHCGSDNVTRDGLLEWDTDAQQWVKRGELDNTDCEECGGETSLIDIELKPGEKYDLFSYEWAVTRLVVSHDEEHGCYSLLRYPPNTMRGDTELVSDHPTVEAANLAGAVVARTASGAEDVRFYKFGEESST
jgi:hypothetical protein